MLILHLGRNDYWGMIQLLLVLRSVNSEPLCNLGMVQHLERKLDWGIGLWILA